ncbi:MAG: TIGR00282 family metallophosphoesterase [Hyphomicrobiaceae bacterium]|nr:TIGR00282 family metallophosphoesterase [Hyphomicrobiaceae bacterium]
MRFLFLGDIVGRAARKAVIEMLPDLRRRYRLDFVVVNGENSAGGFGITEQILEDLVGAGADVVTLGNHAFDQKEALVFIERQPRLLRPVNFPPGTPGKGAGLFRAANGADVLVVNAIGRVFMGEFDCPFRAVDHEVTACGLKRGAADAIVVDFHAEATSEKQALAHFLDGRVSTVIGTHTHAPTADDRVLPGGTAYISDVGMCGDYNSVLGMDSAEPVNRFLTRIPRERFEPSLGPVTLSGLAVEIDDASGLAERAGVLRLGGVLAPAEPLFWIEEERSATAAER